jgi:hypothetical protein
MVEQESLLVTAQLSSVRRFFQETSERGFRPEDANRSVNGCFNHCLFFPQGYVLRFPRSPEERKEHIQSVGKELSSLGIRFRLRPPNEQILLVRQAETNGLMAPKIVDAVGSAVLMETIDGVTLDKYVQNDPVHINPQIIERVITHQTESHKKKIVIGDRWNANTMVTGDKRQIVELDHDIKLLGPLQKRIAFELAQNLYHLIHFSAGHRDFMRDTILDIYNRNPQLLETYNVRDIRLFLDNHAQYHYENFKKEGTLYEGFVPPFAEIDQLIAGIKKIEKAPKKLFVPKTTIYAAA